MGYEMVLLSILGIGFLLVSCSILHSMKNAGAMPIDKPEEKENCPLCGSENYSGRHCRDCNYYPGSI